MNLKLEAPFEIAWTLEVKPRLYTVKWTDKEVLQDLHREHMTIKEVTGFLEAAEEKNMFCNEPKIVNIQVIGEF